MATRPGFTSRALVHAAADPGHTVEVTVSVRHPGAASLAEVMQAIDRAAADARRTAHQSLSGRTPAATPRPEPAEPRIATVFVNEVPSGSPPGVTWSVLDAGEGLAVGRWLVRDGAGDPDPGRSALVAHLAASGVRVCSQWVQEDGVTWAACEITAAAPARRAHR